MFQVIYLATFMRNIYQSSKPFNAWCPQKDHTYFNKAAAERCRFNKISCH